MESVNYEYFVVDFSSCFEGLENQMSAGVQYNPDLLMQIGEWCWDKRDYTALDMILANGVDFTMKQDEWTLMSLSTVFLQVSFLTKNPYKKVRA